MKQIICLSILLNTVILQAQDFGKDLEHLAETNQKCLDKGRFMLDCERNYYTQIDSMLNAVYNHIRKPMTEEQKSDLKTAQLSWLKARDKKFNEINKEDIGLGGQDEMLIKYQKKATYVLDRINYFIKQYLNKDE
ncbi:lysozyme inhibitor LprI family protein [uncultured Roseivirga sp.]|uniref:lysozyme inhibitor LprI family protein n=1 Tax=uncultured Roseivirga sp. TaxID=543088 RepID=UPI0030D8764E|tara:strand:+ start:6565 stop:6969 length:405 start_codon:yes stop_codon:yes gene_type:complete